MTIVQRIAGPVQPQDLLDRLTHVMGDTEAYLIAMRHERQQRDQTNTLRQQQDEAYHESLRQDREKVRIPDFENIAIYVMHAGLAINQNTAKLTLPPQILYTTQNKRNMISTIFGMWTLSGPAVRGHA